MSVEERTMSRSALYEIVWSKPLKAVAEELGMKASHVVGVCQYHQIPRPPTGYWSLVKHGKAPPPTPLPAVDDEELEVIELRAADGGCADFDDDIVKLIERARAMTFEVKGDLRGLHPLVRSTRKALREASPDPNNLLASGLREFGPLKVRVSSDSVDRAVCYLDALVRGIFALGGSVEARKDGYQLRTHVTIAGEDVATIRVRERYNQVKVDLKKLSEPDRYFSRSMDYVPNGRLLIDDDSGISRVFCEDGPNRIEEQLTDLIIQFITEAGRRRIRRREEALRTQQREEQDRIRRAREQEIQRRRAELHARQDKERKRVDALLSEAEAWRQARELREYIGAVRLWMVEQHGTIEPGSEREKRLTWAQEQADRRDPLRPSPDSVLDESVP